MTQSSPVQRQPIGVFDSGVGGLTVVRALRRRLPNEHILYLGDTARVPYGSKSADTVIRYAIRATDFLLQRNIKLLVVACNTASAHALDRLTQTTLVPVLGAIVPGAQEAVGATRAHSVGVLGTLGTIRSEAYPRAIRQLASNVKVATQACPLLVPLAEEGWLDGEVPELIARRYLQELALRCPDLDTLVLGCTHYPLFEVLLGRIAASIFRRPVLLVDSAAAMARATERLLKSANALSAGPGGLSSFVTDDARIDEVGARFLGESLGEIERVDL